MKKLNFAIAAVVMGFVMAACSTTSPKETILKAADEFFTKAEADVNAIQTAEDFMNYFKLFENDKEEFMNKTFEPYLDAEGNVKGITKEVYEEILKGLYDRATAYNKVEGAKAAEFIEPAIAQYEKAIDAVCEGFGNVDEETFDQLTTNLKNAENGLALFAEYDNVPVALQERGQAAQAKLDDFLKMLE